MKRIRFMLFALLAMLYATNASALIVGNKITRLQEMALRTRLRLWT